ncbi:helix-turn-helix domain-containing protein [filamentous cyanobacterium LEGE 11480]|uniref:Helix-turn-helix domain-containing protein n=1 Tax=Romeriopsis navalis LEGE 11480 TaxID=2777977 RepID=A0A928VRV2_9CYAN|nr:helix-turn-helix domain-containing protein [Romeriopsis navalis]MBE9032607.1 helix-turn-helix domain-containing protein [Romeriopsis navalis LEGE 11480]
MSAPQLDYTDRLQGLMQACDIKTYAQLCQTTGVSEKVIRRLRRGQIQQMQIGTLQKIAQGLDMSAATLLATFTDSTRPKPTQATTTPSDLQLEYDRLQQQLQTQRETLLQEFQQASLQILESWLLQWPTAAYAAQQNPTAPAVKLLPLVKPVENLLKQWDLAPIGRVGETLNFDPTQHQVMGARPNPGDPVRVRYIGYQQGDRLLHRAKVSPVE